MIDYEKLKQAHELCKELSDQSDECLTITYFCQPRREPHFRLEYVDGKNKFNCPMGLDSIIAKLQELIRPVILSDASEELEQLFPDEKGEISLPSGYIRIIDNKFYRVKKLARPQPKFNPKDEYCEVSGAKLGKLRPMDCGINENRTIGQTSCLITKKPYVD